MKMDMLPLISNLLKISGKETALYIVPDAPFWFVPSPAGHEAIKRCRNPLDVEELGITLRNLTGKSLINSGIEAHHLLTSLSFCRPEPYNGRASKRLESLTELWFHLTDACNLKCSHCLFGNNRSRGRVLEPRKIKKVISDARKSGCGIICFTGGEPFVYPEFTGLIEHIQASGDTRIAVLTNGLLIDSLLDSRNRLDAERIHLQVSLDGPGEFHDRQRGAGTCSRTTESIRRLVDAGFNVSVAMAANASNVESMPMMPDILADIGVDTLHFQWHFDQGPGKDIGAPDIRCLVQGLRDTYVQAKRLDIAIDNMEAVASQLFSPAGTRFDLGNAGWESLAVGPDGSVFPTPAMVDRPFFRVGHMDSGIMKVWQESKSLKKIRHLSLMDCPDMAGDPWRFITGGGDLDHCTVWDHAKDIPVLNKDPYAPLYTAMATMLIEDEIKDLPCPEGPGIALRMGDVTSQCPSSAHVNFIHCNCLLSMGQGESHGLIRDFYARRAETPDELILNPVKFNDDEMDFIPDEAKVRMYGCGSPVVDAAPARGEVVVDLGSGTGVECFMAARAVGPEGRVIGIDMTQRMLDMARQAAEKVEERLGYGNVRFIKGYLEQLPLEDGSVDVVISNCVLNLTGNKRRVLKEIFRVLRPKGRVVISDVVTETDPPLEIRADHQLAGECIGGALVQDYLFAILRDTGFRDSTAIKRFPYRQVRGHDFFSLTFAAFRPAQPGSADDMEHEGFYAGPFQALVTENGDVMKKGSRGVLHLCHHAGPDALASSGLYIVDKSTGAITNSEAQCDCACFTGPDTEETGAAETVPATGCLICGAPLEYLTVPEDRVCSKCGNTGKANAVCRKGHFVCDLCHIQDPVKLIKKVCLETKEVDTIRLMNRIRALSQVPLHGPEHHGMIPGVILSAYRNLGGGITDTQIMTGIERGALVPGGACAFMAVCGAVLGAGIAFSIILEVTPLTPAKRQKIQSISVRLLQKVAGYRAARCCRRECCLTLMEAAEISRKALPIPIRADGPVTCNQHKLNSECIKSCCPFYPGKDKTALDRFDITGQDAEPSLIFSGSR